MGQYELCELVGEGSMGRVYRAIDQRTGREAAVKILRPELAREPLAIGRFETEAKTLASLQHPHIAGLFAFFDHQGQLCMATEFVRGPSLAQRLRRGRLERREAISVAARLLDALAYSHARGVVHRDLKPSNVLLADGGFPKLSDFGIARRMQRARRGQRPGEREVIGTIEYMAPERIEGEVGDAKCDVYAMGLMLWEMLTGALPFDTSTDEAMLRWHLRSERPVAPGASPTVQALVRAAIDRQPHRRPSAQECRAALVAAAVRQAHPISTGDLLRWASPFLAFAAGLGGSLALR